MRFLDTHGNEAEIVFDPLVFGVPLAVWVFAFHDGRLVLPRHRVNGLGWIVGTLAQGEPPEDAARRAALEQAGARVIEMAAIGQFRGIRPDGGPRRSTIYLGLATRLEGPPVESGVASVELAAPDDLTVVRDGGRFMQDPSYAVVMTHLTSRGLIPGQEPPTQPREESLGPTY